MLLKRLVDEHCLVALKVGTEVEDMDIDFMGRMFEMAKENRIPVWFKIGGPEARVDIRTALMYGARKIIAPMCESLYATRNFVKAVRDYDKTIELGLNIETANAVMGLDEVWLKDIGHVTIGRSDLCSSIGRVKINSAEMMLMCRKVFDKCSSQSTSVGGGMEPDAAKAIWKVLAPDTVNTRHCVIICNENVDANVKAALEWEAELYGFEAERCRKEFNLARAEECKKRAG